MKRFLYPLLILCSTTVLGQSSNTEEVIRKVADNVIQNTSFKFINTNTKEKYDSTKGLASSPDIKADSKYNKWMYVNGVLTIGIVQIADVLGDKKYSDYSQRNFAFIFDNLGYFEALRKAKVPKVEYGAVFSISNLDACGAMSAGLFDVDALANRKDYKAYLSRSADYILNKQLRLPDGTLSRPAPRNMTLWADDMFMSIPFLARMGKQTGDSKYFDDAIKQVENFNKHLYDPTTGLFFHNYYSDDQTNGVGHWGRSNGWIAMAIVELLNNLPANHPKRAEIIKLLLRQIVGYSRYQDQTGLWHQLLDKPDSYLETSVTAMYTYAVARAVNQGWINEKYIAIAHEGWRGLLTKVTADGQLQDVCIGTNMDTDIKFYYTRPTELNDTHGTGAFLLAGIEILKAERKK
ncbi:glycoside hydrolase family 88/105 protein [Mucilaginibacter lappiensis]|uniref:Rhamnogalacturonyl hydrolase YesR n=1 Tax=Mucilaginibacter lappiensis TaxID=354630 RepID=A0A841JC66_9SPHI|nr:glycoside hydrolase family 88 protein [Mucilaginibacter lappiensis]MBB6126178.1 rhamnogalacturonyl hydrolase YesR [Mucilaginibacter lappiensis]